ncbi:S8 family peptidase [Mycobacterium intracellulare]|uniref:S8 family peptidase n=1 Tax=Mycobacterium intracellulare TaxID=1767 RepID=A0AAE4REQ6_MYCIT|nr:S8 family peptidase [Mycobacterium intracellulare]MCA2318083.1 S8 family peptidase [Mycobacterium intracellulare]MCA2340419.1 S8 family peptidase [Mycobacterium intracellulare]MDV6974689.1 S8 family peptidase [Mycobacterium intracellulare]MDV6981188.1 S8 family peptidase [Mycobacterium intracellulare]MDV7011586.1 S8 family peptidase [Mycobacterium intracellulare]
MAERDRPHIVVRNLPTSEPFTLASAGGGTEKEPFTGDRPSHGRRLTRELQDAISPPTDEAETAGAYVTFVSFPGLELALESLDPQSSGEQPELLAVRQIATDDGDIQMATVFIPDGKKQYFFKRLSAYVETASNDKARHAALVERIQSIRRATIRELWTDPDEQFPDDHTELRWWEVWLRNRDSHELQRFTAFASERRLRTSQHYLGFGDRTVVLLRATADQLSQTFESLDDIAELRRPHDVASFLAELPASEQMPWADDLLNRLQAADGDAPVVCVLDTGVQDSHPLLTASLDALDVHRADASWQVQPVHPHGTEMAGLALYSDLQNAITGAHTVELLHRLESVKFLPDTGGTDRDLYGAITARSVDRPEIQAPDRPRVFMLAVTAPRPNPIDGETEPAENYEAGRPTSWSAAIDALAFGRAIDDTDLKFTYLDRDEPRRPRLFVVSAGNIRDLNADDDHLARSDLEPIEDPAQAWNALTVGAYSAHDDMANAPTGFEDYVPIAPRGELAPVSRTSVVFDRKKWPFKPDVVADGGNVAASPDGTGVDTPPNLALLTTRLQGLGQGLFTTTRDTSAATAQVAAIAADICAAYPDLKPETVRGLVVHSAQWTEAMENRFAAESNKTRRGSLLRRYGMGVPDLARACQSAIDALTLVAEARIHPYEQGASSAAKVREMNVHQLPWPTAALESLGDVTVHLRVTLSYFIEPNPSSRGWTGRYVYPSHGLRFATRRPEDSIETFRQRINTRARAEGQKPPSLETETGWLFGANQQQSPGSIHTDIWSGSAIDLASKGAIAVYPVAGWWKNRRGYDQSNEGVDYSLIVSIESREVEIDLWTPVMQQIAAEVQIET